MAAERIHGFTLVEMLIAIGILAMIAVLGWRSMDGMIRSRAALTDSMQQLRALQRSFAQMQEDCAQLATPDAIGTGAPLQIQPDRLALIRNVFTPDQPTRLQAVVWYVAGGVLKRRVSPESRDLPALKQFLQQSTGGLDQTLQSDVHAMGLRAWSAGWRSQIGGTAPTRGLEVTLQLGRGEGTVRRLFLLGAA
ncbi:MAG TPA: prepilin-type N-terminal cleavage/methylation domain-containing protein [Oxalicibacterium sp.]|jgi:general secretion pathway protein J|nr:prepilin-type N-terminal cleavage/methylation domain-containing protein [Oxalicibacterium sp.]